MRIPDATRLILLSGLLATFPPLVAGLAVKSRLHIQDGGTSSSGVSSRTDRAPETRPISVRDKGTDWIRRGIASDPSLKAKRDPMMGGRPHGQGSLPSSAATSSDPRGWKPIPDNVNPGIGGLTGPQLTPTRIQSMREYELRGARQLKMLEERIAAHTPDTLIVQSVDAWRAARRQHGENSAFMDVRASAGYRVSDESRFTEEWMQWEGRPLNLFQHKDLNFNIYTSKRLIETTVYPKHDSHCLNQGKFDTNGRFMVLELAYKNFNIIFANTPKIPVNEMTMQNFLRAAGAKAVHLQVMFLTDIQNREFWAITRSCYNDVKKTFQQQAIFHRGTPQFDRFMGSPNIASKFYGLANHHNALGHKIPDKIIINPRQMPQNHGLNVAIVLKAAAGGSFPSTGGSSSSAGGASSSAGGTSTPAGGTSTPAGGSSSADQGTGSKGGDKDGDKGGDKSQKGGRWGLDRLFGRVTPRSEEFRGGGEQHDA